MNTERAKELSKANLELLFSKNQDYGVDGLVKGGLSGVLTRAGDKVERFRHLAGKGERPNHESLFETGQDLHNYGTLLQLLAEGSLLPAPTFCYLAGAIDNATSEQAKDWREYASTKLLACGVTCFNPYGAYFGATMGAAAVVHKVNNTAIDLADVVLVNLLKDVPVFGTIREIEYARAQDKLVVVATHERPLGLMGYDLVLTDTLDEAIDHILGRGKPSDG